ncbi:MAG: putative ABC transporter permease, partial [Intestinibacter sp.]
MKIKEKYMEKENRLTIHQIFWYLVIFSIIGLIIETIYGYATTGILESRKGLIWGPFCPVYGVGAVVLILLLNHVDQKNYFKLFIYGFLIGAASEYIMSYVLEAFYGIRFWDYTYT